MDHEIQRLPILTLAVCLLCALTFLFQYVSESHYKRKLADFCLDGIDAPQKAILNHIQDADLGTGCEQVFPSLRQSTQQDALLDKLGTEVSGIAYYLDPEQNLRFNRERLKAGFAGFQSSVPDQLTDKLVYRPESHDPVTMFTSTFAHATWDHLVGNLFFFFAFACCVECLLGRMAVAACFAAMVFACNLVYSRAAMATGNHPTLGLSGVAMGMMAMAAVLLPTGRISFFVLSPYMIRTISAPVLRIAGLFVVLNIVEFWLHADTHINYVLHIAGVATGVLLGAGFRMFAPARLLAVEKAKAHP
jgi:membrane associated rhomboid family serine protease